MSSIEHVLCGVVCVSVLDWRPYGKVYVFASTLCKYDVRKGDLFVLSWGQGATSLPESVSSVVFICCHSLKHLLRPPVSYLEGGRSCHDGWCAPDVVLPSFTITVSSSRRGSTTISDDCLLTGNVNAIVH